MKRVELAKLLEEVVASKAYQPEGAVTKCNFASSTRFILFVS